MKLVTQGIENLYLGERTGLMNFFQSNLILELKYSWPNFHVQTVLQFHDKCIKRRSIFKIKLISHCMISGK